MFCQPDGPFCYSDANSESRHRQTEEEKKSFLFQVLTGCLPERHCLLSAFCRNIAPLYFNTLIIMNNKNIHKYNFMSIVFVIMKLHQAGWIARRLTLFQVI